MAANGICRYSSYEPFPPYNHDDGDILTVHYKNIPRRHSLRAAQNVSHPVLYCEQSLQWNFQSELRIPRITILPTLTVVLPILIEFDHLPITTNTTVYSYKKVVLFVVRLFAKLLTFCFLSKRNMIDHFLITLL